MKGGDVEFPARVQIVTTDEWVERVERYRKKHKMESRSAVIRLLVERGLDDDETKDARSTTTRRRRRDGTLPP